MSHVKLDIVLLEACEQAYSALKDIINASDNGYPYDDEELKRNFNSICNNLYDVIERAKNA